MNNYIEIDQTNWFKIAMDGQQFFAWLLAGNPIYTYHSFEVELGGVNIVTPRTVTPEEAQQTLQRIFEIDKHHPPYALLGKYFIKTPCADGIGRLMYVGKNPEHLKALTWFMELAKASKSKNTKKIEKLKTQFMDIQECLAKEGFVYVRQSDNDK